MTQRDITMKVSEELNEKYGHLMPSSDYAETLEGECVRAFNRIAYRYYNDGDNFREATYGGSSANAAYNFLLAKGAVKIDSLTGDTEKDIEIIGRKTLEFIDKSSHNGIMFNANDEDMLDYADEVVEEEVEEWEEEEY